MCSTFSNWRGDSWWPSRSIQKKQNLTSPTILSDPSQKFQGEEITADWYQSITSRWENLLSIIFLHPPTLPRDKNIWQSSAHQIKKFSTTKSWKSYAKLGYPWSKRDEAGLVTNPIYFITCFLAYGGGVWNKSIRKLLIILLFSWQEEWIINISWRS